jgi:hypothetical protein
MTVGETILALFLGANIIITFIVAWLHLRKLDQVQTVTETTHEITNNRMSQMLRIVRKSSLALGVKRGRAMRNNAPSRKKKSASK